ncbi:CRIB domain-containing protein RIC10-like [Zingiber officinale]|uniref:CRIB domain-containing protein RIC10-like n=1 Tax=Zingiber officinale TaxID=94328 RepID=UPI001C4B6E3B|nr:CRIB domain-containing protein RIC10-like [Zingiber officinale]
MATRVKGLFRGFKHISKIFVVKEDEMEIGHPTDVKHVAHIGWDRDSVHSPSWMKRFDSPSDFSSPSNVGQSRRSSLASRGLDRPRSIQTSFRSTCSSETDDNSTTPKKMKRRRHRAASSSSSLTHAHSKRSSRLRAPYVASLGDDHEAQDQLRGV